MYDSNQGLLDSECSTALAPSIATSMYLHVLLDPPVLSFLAQLHIELLHERPHFPFVVVIDPIPHRVER
jgi:hypothetical protein